MYDQRALFAKLIQIFNNDSLNEVDGPKYDYPTLCRFYASGFINNVLKHFQSSTEHLGKAGSLKVPPVGLFFEERKGDRSMAEKHAELRKRQRHDREEAARKAKREEEKREKDKKETRERILEKRRNEERRILLEEREAANKKKMSILKGKTSSAGGEETETNQPLSPSSPGKTKKG